MGERTGRLHSRAPTAVGRRAPTAVGRRQRWGGEHGGGDSDVLCAGGEETAMFFVRGGEERAMFFVRQRWEETTMFFVRRQRWGGEHGEENRPTPFGPSALGKRDAGEVVRTWSSAPGAAAPPSGPGLTTATGFSGFRICCSRGTSCGENAAAAGTAAAPPRTAPPTGGAVCRRENYYTVLRHPPATQFCDVLVAIAYHNSIA